MNAFPLLLNGHFWIPLFYQLLGRALSLACRVPGHVINVKKSRQEAHQVLVQADESTVISWRWVENAQMLGLEDSKFGTRRLGSWLDCFPCELMIR